MITTIFFDIGNVLVGFDHTLIWQRLAPFSTLAPEELQQHIVDSGLMQQHETGQLPPLELFRQLQKSGQFLPSFPYQTFSRLWADIFWEHTPVIQCASILQRKYTIGLLSNVGEIHWNWLLQRFSIFRQVSPDMRVLSFQVGAMKPSDDIYLDAIMKAQSEPEHCVYIDDIQEYADASRELGIQAIHYQSPEQLQQELGKLQIMV
jgi:putative hydrolase of the HAD superfamily